jgi:alcohol dehydrogenase, propanol-preferring
MAQQYAKAMGLRIIAIDGGEEKGDACKQLGAEVRHPNDNIQY